LIEGGAGNGGEGDITLNEVPVDAVKAIRGHRTAGASFFPIRAEHEVVDSELAAAIEKLG